MSAIKNWQEERQAAYLYQLIADHESDAIHKKLFLELKSAAEKQASIWAEQIDKKVSLIYKPDIRTRLVGLLVIAFGAHQVRFILSAMKVRGMSIYSGSITSHSAHGERRHQGLNTAGNLRAAVFGVNDGLVSNMSLVLGVFGANANLHMVLLSGIAGLLAGAFSMGAGEYISMRSQREFFEYQIELEKEELELYPSEEAYELACIYRARGVPFDEAKKMAELIISDPDKALSTLAREELGLNPDELGSPIGAAAASFLSFTLGALIPLLPFLCGSQNNTIIYGSIGLTAVSLFLIGGILSLFTNRSAFLGGLRMLMIGTIAGVVTFLIGKWIGVSLG
ncbi:MAG: hypothetical protein ACD_60C00137G0031 [uncultured bacterium]|nr:MAG: hypothetical protein ACD_60C00137G0031 [uncultured bacterium]